MRAHESKQVERRAMFLSKVQAPPSPSAITLPKTPPDSPAIFHYTLPSPGLNSPLTLFGALSDNALASIGLHSVEPWVEQVDFRLLNGMQSKSSSKSTVSPLQEEYSMTGKSIPSLDQISAHLSSLGHVSPVPRPERSSMRLPAFLLSHSADPPRASIPTDVLNTEPTKSRLSFPISVGRLKIPVCPPPVSSPQVLTATSTGHNDLTPTSKGAPLVPTLQVTTTRVPRSATFSPTELSEHNVSILASRARTAKDMLSTLSRRMHPSEQGLTGHDQKGEERKERRRSSPAEMPPTERSGFTHPALSWPGGF